jgi:hypothetical protein
MVSTQRQLTGKGGWSFSKFKLLYENCFRNLQDAYGATDDNLSAEMYLPQIRCLGTWGPHSTYAI